MPCHRSLSEATPAIPESTEPALPDAVPRADSNWLVVELPAAAIACSIDELLSLVEPVAFDESLALVEPDDDPLAAVAAPVWAASASHGPVAPIELMDMRI
jgi:hypothetical protein